MKIRLENLKLSLDVPQEALLQAAAKKLNLKGQQIGDLKIRKKSLDARKKQDLKFVYTIDAELPDQVATKILHKHLPGVSKVEEALPPKLVRGDKQLAVPPIVIGAGPSGLFAALKLALLGYKPLVLERGKKVAERRKDITEFWTTGKLDLDSNMQFGEGGAGTYSDGKLTTRSKDPKVAEVLEYLVEAGAPPEITYIQKPHLGTDKLEKIVANLGAKITSLGGQIFFQAKVTDLIINHNRLEAIEVNQQYELPAQLVVLATGHSARDVFELLAKREVTLETKPFAMGVRIEHQQSFINKAQYGDFAEHPSLGAADYKLTYQSKQYQRGAYSFCMCPGGYVVACSSEKNTVVTNGMSEYARDSGLANSALVVTISPDDFPSPGPLGGIAFQRQWERKAFQLGGSNYHAPGQTVEDFLQDRPSSSLEGKVKPTYRPGLNPANLRESLPKEVGEVLQEALVDFNQKIKGFAQEDAVLTGVETRTSSPVRIVRSKDCTAHDHIGIYPVGEGAGYAGGIVSAAVDGLRAAEAIITNYGLPQKQHQLNFFADK
ncbi:hypothetical protein RDV78_02220 [Bacillota bacterium LX-D]|nr:hypothetical protein [Bacillota bacterium LX-D]